MTTARQCLFGGVLALVASGCRVDSVSQPSFSRVTPGASFDWRMPERFGLDRDGDGLIDYPRHPEDISPGSWTVAFDACALPRGHRRTEYVWYIDHVRAASVTSCDWTHEFPAEGSYQVALQVIPVPGPVVWAEDVVTVQDWLIVSFGDSYASGEGVPEVPGANDELVRAIETTIRNLVAARDHLSLAGEHLDDAVANLAEAFERKGLAESILATQQQRLNQFLTACHIETFRDILACADFLAGLPFDTYETASAHFRQAVTDAQERVDSLTQAYLAAQAAWSEARAAFDAALAVVAGLQATLAELQEGLRPARWQAPFSSETWVDNGNPYDCHRSANAAPARAALALERSDPRTSVTFVHLACTGARIDTDRNRLQQQIPWAEALIGPREIDAVLVSIGGNDAGFANIATACVVQQPCYLADPVFNPAEAAAVCSLLAVIGLESQCNDLFGNFPDRSAKLIVEEGVGALPPRYQHLAQDLLPELSGLLEPEARLRRHTPPSDGLERLRSNRVYITEYVDMTRDDAGAYCRADIGNLLGTVPGISADEMGWLDLFAAGSINQATRDAAAAHGWNAVGGIYAGYMSHGYCADDHWVVRAYETFLVQGDQQGIAHPNNAGHRHNGQAILAALMPHLYPQGLGGTPRAPDQTLSPPAAVAAPTLQAPERP